MRDTINAWLADPEIPETAKVMLRSALESLDGASKDAAMESDPAEAIRQAGKRIDNVAAKLMSIAAYIDAQRRLSF